ncbi:hypothetical protein TIFTF001_007575 [Ficus carica]|uniref:Calcineurin-like phosphoesterase domain-containing protein n=1 Tax=Ficus carica TaxID=3494 RepID=A0AA88D241_FICCA|nr:hypothetical protein TIFTF001_007575 [Ficus carica]
MGRIGEKLEIDFVISTGDNFYENGLNGVVLGNHDYRGDTEAQLKTAEFFFVDATPFVVSYFFEKDHTYDWQGVSPRGTYLANLLKDLEMSLRESSAKWKIVVGHHAIRSAGHHAWNTLISSKTSAIQFLTSGAGSKAWRGDMKKISNHAAMKFFYDGQGFMSLQLTREDAEFVF